MKGITPVFAMLILLLITLAVVGFAWGYFTVLISNAPPLADNLCAKLNATEPFMVRDCYAYDAMSSGNDADITRDFGKDLCICFNYELDKGQFIIGKTITYHKVPNGVDKG